MNTCHKCHQPLPPGYDVILMDATRGVTVYQKECLFCKSLVTVEEVSL